MKEFTLERFIFNYVYNYVSECRCIHMSTGSIETRRGRTDPRSWNYRWLGEALLGCWEPNRGPLQEQCMHLIAESCLQPRGLHFFVCKLKACNFPFVPWLENNCTVFLSLTSVQIFPECLLCWREVKLNTSHIVSTVKEFPFSRKRERKKTTQTELKTVHKIFSWWSLRK